MGRAVCILYGASNDLYRRRHWLRLRSVWHRVLWRGRVWIRGCVVSNKAIATSAPLPKRPRVVVQPAASTKLKAEPVERVARLVCDSHCHALAAAAEEEEEAHDVSGVCLISAGESDWSVAAAAEGRRGGSGRKYAIGVHPWYAHTQDDGWEDRLRSALDNDANAIVGETGLDRARLEECPWEGQVHAFTTQLRLASELRGRSSSTASAPTAR